jgi:hypothetical protein
MDKDEQELELEDEISEEISEEEDDETSLDAVLIDEDEFVQESVGAEDLATGFNATIPTREIDVDEDIQGDEVAEAGREELLSEFEVAGDAVIHYACDHEQSPANWKSRHGQVTRSVDRR